MPRGAGPKRSASVASRTAAERPVDGEARGSRAATLHDSEKNRRLRSKGRTIGARRGFEGKQTTPSLSTSSDFARTTAPRVKRCASGKESGSGKRGSAGIPTALITRHAFFHAPAWCAFIKRIGPSRLASDGSMPRTHRFFASTCLPADPSHDPPSHTIPP